MHFFQEVIHLRQTMQLGKYLRGGKKIQVVEFGDIKDMQWQLSQSAWCVKALATKPKLYEIWKLENKFLIESYVIVNGSSS